MATKKKPVAITTTTGHKAELIKLMRSLAHRHDLWRVFSDFVEMAAVSIANACDRSNLDHDAREARYMEIIKAYTREELQTFPQMLSHLTLALECSMDDVLGEVFMELELGSKWHGQFFTPYEVCRLMAGLTAGDLSDMIDRQGFVTVNEPTCGGGAMIIAMADHMRSIDINYQQCMHVIAQDLDLKAVHMAYVQLSLLHIPATVIHGNTLAVEERSHWNTPAHIMGGWAWKLRRRRMTPAQELEVQQPVAEVAPEPAPAMAPPAPLPPPSQWQQAGLF